VSVDQHELAAVLDLQDEVPQFEVRPLIRKVACATGYGPCPVASLFGWRSRRT
jgi:hypothetical protein